MDLFEDGNAFVVNGCIQNVKAGGGGGGG